MKCVVVSLDQIIKKRSILHYLTSVICISPVRYIILVAFSPQFYLLNEGERGRRRGNKSMLLYFEKIPIIRALH